jgi:hypothetical protein
MPGPSQGLDTIGYGNGRMIENSAQNWISGSNITTGVTFIQHMDTEHRYR